MHIMVNPITDGLPSDQVKNATKTSKRLNLTPGTPFERTVPRKNKQNQKQPASKNPSKNIACTAVTESQKPKQPKQTRLMYFTVFQNCVTHPPTEQKTTKPVTKLFTQPMHALNLPLTQM